MMARVGYDAFEGLKRLAEAGERLDIGVAEVLVYHLAVEREVALVVDKLAVYPDPLRSLSHANRMKVLGAFWRGPKEAGEALLTVLQRFNELRNGVAHGDPPRRIEAAKSRLREAFAVLLPGDDENQRTIPEIAAGVIGFLADNPSNAQLRLRRMAADVFEQTFAGHDVGTDKAD
ncbi:hypothetical protein GGQ93_002717 [Brevundimonas aurantiaca]|jgi:hypothetical protein|uniref:Uncharacterized protein n=2 Tax=Brevundimonas aurantiaca TaxID=74316 RepID=A0A7W9F9C9_9CAUL|nr:hypothetical protein [Brevundimonas aurantiaca]